MAAAIAVSIGPVELLGPAKAPPVPEPQPTDQKETENAPQI